MAAPMGAIIQAIDHAMGRMQAGMGAGIKVAGSQNGQAANVSGVDSGTAQNFNKAEDLDTKENEAMGSNNTVTGEVKAPAGEASGILGSESSSEEGEDASSLIASDEKLKHARDCAICSMKDWKIGRSLASDGKLKSGKNVSARQYGTNVANSISNAALVAQGKQPVNTVENVELKDYMKEGDK